jgi:hypothetical protein
MTPMILPMTAPTLDQLRVMTPQDLFDHTARSLRMQGVQATSPAGNCQYQTAEGNRCAVGWLIPDEFLTQSKNCFGGVNDLIHALQNWNISLELGEVFATHLGLLQGLQAAHDQVKKNSPAWGHYFLQRMRRTAEEYSLNTLALEEVTE